MKNKSGARTLWMSVLMSAPGPLIILWGMRLGRSATQLADLVRRSSELAALIVALAVFLLTRESGDEVRNRRLERRANLLMGAAMILSGAAMLAVNALSRSQTGNVLPGLIIALLGVIANTLFWRKYTRLSRAEGNAILAVQSRLYRAKALVDGCVSVALLAVMALPGSVAALWLDKAGSAVVADYLIWCGVRTMREAI